MKLLCIALFGMIIIFSGLQGILEPFEYIGNVRFAGKPAVYASSDTLAMVYQDEQNRLCFRLKNESLPDAMISYPLTENPNCKAPTLLYSPVDCYITTNRGIGKSIDGGITWQPEIFRGVSTYENSPILEKYNNELHLFTNSIPYPEDIQEQFALPGTDEFPIPQLIVDKPYWDGTTENYTSIGCMGTDYYSGPVFVNGNLWLRNSPGSANPDSPGWPRFDGPVFCAGVVMVYGGGNYPANAIFHGGLYENQANAVLPSSLAVCNSGQSVGPSAYSPNHIVYIEMNGDTYTGMLGIIQQPRRKNSEVWPSYPMGSDLPPDAINHYTVCDTVWTPIPSGNCANRGSFVNSKLWIKGHFSSKQVWAAADTICIIGDITLDGVTPGLPPTNANDAVTLISEKSVLLKYGYKSPVDNTRIHPFCRADSDPIYLYANFAALGEGQGIEEKDGVFSFEYQHPHPSIPDLTLNIPPVDDSLITNIDLHRNHYPQSTQHLWPGWLDYPWYNPLWPEAHPYLGRGRVIHYGGVYQQRWGKLWSKRVPDPNHNPNNYWDIGNGKYGGPSNELSQEIVLWQDPPQSINLQSLNYPGASQSTVGYTYEGYYPAGLSLSNMAALQSEGMWNLGLSTGYWYSDDLNDHLYYQELIKPQLKVSRVKEYATKGQASVYSVNDLLVHRGIMGFEDLSSLTEAYGLINSLVLDEDNNIWLCQSDTGTDFLVKHINPVTEQIIGQFIFPITGRAHDLFVMPNGLAYFAKQLQGNQFGVYSLNHGSEPILTETWELTSEQGNPDLIIDDESKLYVIPSGGHAANILVWNRTGDNTGRGCLYLATADLPLSSSDDILPQPVPASFSCYPNPMRGNLQIKLSLPPQTKAELAVYNLKGQKIKSYNGLDAGTVEFTWDGLDHQGKSTASGIYFLRLSSQGNSLQSKRICKF